MHKETLAWLENLLTWQYLLGITFQLMFLAEFIKIISLQAMMALALLFFFKIIIFKQFSTMTKPEKNVTTSIQNPSGR